MRRGRQAIFIIEVGFLDHRCFADELFLLRGSSSWSLATHKGHIAILVVVNIW
jgi:hypothetical protein